MQPRRIAYFLNIFPKVSETFIISEVAELRRRGVELRIFSLLPPRDQIHHDLVAGLGLDEIVSYDVPAFPDAVREFAPDLLHAHFAKEATEAARAISSGSGVPFTFTAHGYDIFRKPPRDFRERALAARAVVTVSAANADYIRKTFEVPAAHVRVIPCGVDLCRFRPPSAAAPTPDPPLVLCVTRMAAVKNLGLLLEACARLRDRGTQFRCVLVGDGPLRAELEARRAALHLDGMVEMPGAAGQQEVAAWWQQASAGVLTSDNEGMPVCLMEAAASGVPVVATRVGGIPELVEDQVTGLLCGAGDAAGIAGALDRLLKDRELARRMGAAARARAEARFSVARQVDDLLALWTVVLAEVPA